MKGIFSSKKSNTTETIPKHISLLPPDIITRIFSFLPVPQLPRVASVSRRFKLLCYGDAVYENKLHLLRMASALQLDGEMMTLSLKDSLAARLRQLPGGQFLPTGGKFMQIEKVLSPLVSPSLTLTISSALPDSKTSHLIIGSGGLKAALSKSQQGNRPGRKAFEKPVLERLDSKYKNSVREAFRKVYIELYPYYIDFEEKSNDSLVFRDYKDPSELGAVLCRLLLFDQAMFLGRDTSDISSNLSSTIEWFESRLLGLFDVAYDKNDIEQMRVNAYATYQLNGGLGCVNVFIAKNAVFFDQTFNPSLLDSKLPLLVGPAMGYSLADEFATYIEYMLVNCTKQAELVSKVFVPDVAAMTLFLDKVFEDCISEYLSAVIAAAKAREGLGIYLHTLATSVYCCSQFQHLMLTNQFGVKIDERTLKNGINEIFMSSFEKYLDLEMEFVKKRFKVELDKWDHRKAKGKNTLAEADKARQKRSLMMKSLSILMTPVTLLAGPRRAQAEPLLEKHESMEDTHNDTATYDAQDDSMNSLVSVELAIHLIHTNKESLGRVLVILASIDMTKIRGGVQKVFVSLLKALGEGHLKPAFQQAIERLSRSTPQDFGDGNKMINMDSLQFFDLIHMGDLIQQMIQVYYQEDIRMWIDENDFLSEIMIEKKNFERLLDDSVAAGMDKAIQVLINQCEFLLISSHEQTDYNIASNAVIDFKPTKACDQVMSCLETHTTVLRGSIEANTMEVFLSEVSVRLFQVIIKNIRRLQVSQTGAMRLICDLNRYYDWAYSLRLSSSTKMFKALKELGNLFLADGSEELRSLVHDSPRFNGALRIEEIYELLQSRTDYKEIRSQVEAKECCIQ